MYDYKGLHELKAFYTIPEVCELLDLDMDKLRYLFVDQCILPVHTKDGTLGIDIYSFQNLNTTLYHKQCREGIHDDDPWA